MLKVCDSFQMGMWITWKDPRLDFHDLNVDDSLNQMTTEDKKKIWVPSLIFTNTAGRYHVRYNYERSIGILTRSKGKCHYTC